jgi:hypothetical protein
MHIPPHGFNHHLRQKEELTPTQTDDFPIITEMNLAPELTNAVPKRNFRTTDWKKFGTALESKLQNLPAPNPITSKEEAQDRLNSLLEAIITTIEEKVPLSKPSPYAKRWWSAELDVANKNLKKIAYQAKARRRYRGDPIHEEHRKARNAFAKSVEKAKEEHWNEYLENVELTNL